MEPMTMMALGGGIGGALGGLGGKAGAKAANQPTTTSSQSTSRLDPYGGERGTNYLSNLLNRGTRLHFQTERPNIGPSSEMERVYGNLSGLLGGSGQGGGGPRQTGGGGPSGGGHPGGGGAPAGPLGGSIEKFGDYLGGYQVEPNEWMRNVLEGGFLNKNPFQDAMVGQMRDSYERSLGNIDARFAQGGRFGGGALAGAHVLANQGFNQDVNATLGGMFENERNRMTDVLGMLSGENTAARGTLGGVKQSQISGEAGIRQSGIAAAAQRYAANKSLQGVLAGVNATRSNNRFNQNLALLNAAGGMDDRRNANAMLPYEMLQSASSFGLPLLSTFGTQNQSETSTTQGPRQSPGMSALLGAGGGALQGSGLGSMFGQAQGPPQMAPTPMGGK